MGQPALDRQLIFLKNSYDFNFGMSLMPIYIYIYAKPNALSGPAFPSKAWIGVLDPRYPQKWEMNVLMIENLHGSQFFNWNFQVLLRQVHVCVSRGSNPI